MFGRIKKNTSFSQKAVEDKSPKVLNNVRAPSHDLLLTYLGHLTFKLATESDQQQERKFKSSLVINALKEIEKANTREELISILSNMLAQYVAYMDKNKFVIVPSDGMNQISSHLDELEKQNMQLTAPVLKR